MPSTMILTIDLGGTKVAFGAIDEHGAMHFNERVLINNLHGDAVGTLITHKISQIIKQFDKGRLQINAIGVSVPGIVRHQTGTVWVPNIKGWEDYPLKENIQQVSSGIPIILESDRTCYVLGEKWMGCAKGCDNVIFLAIGTGIGAGIIANGSLVKGANDIGGAVGWMVHSAPQRGKADSSGCAFESCASGNGMVKLAQGMMNGTPGNNSTLISDSLKAQHIFTAYDTDEIAREVVQHCIKQWGMAVANLVSIFNPEKVILGGGVFGPAVRFIPEIRQEAKKWAQPVSEKLYALEASQLGKDAGLYGAAYAALQFLNARINEERVS